MNWTSFLMLNGMRVGCKSNYNLYEVMALIKVGL